MMHSFNGRQEGENKYTDSFYSQHLSGSINSGRMILECLFAHFKPKTVLDVGCGRGTWLHAVNELGIDDVQGIDGQYVDRDSLLIDPTKFLSKDLRAPLSLNRRFDLTISVEVAEHLPLGRAEGFVYDLCKTSDAILFSAALPYQGGEDHINEQWPEYWALLFRSAGYQCFDIFRDQFWGNVDVESWYSQNIFLFVKEGSILAESLAVFLADTRPLSKVHPEIFLINVNRYRPAALAQLQDEIEAWKRLVKVYVSGGKVTPDTAVENFDPSLNRTNEFSSARLAYLNSADVKAEIAAAEAESRDRIKAHTEEIVLLSEEITRLSKQSEKFYEKIDLLSNEIELERENRIDAVAAKTNEIIDASVHIAEQSEAKIVLLKENIAALQAELVEARNVNIQKVAQSYSRRASDLLLERASSVPDVLRKVIPRPLRLGVKYLRNYADVKYLRSSGYFDKEWYCQKYTDVAEAGIDPVRHYVFHGASEGRNPHPRFDTNKYRFSRGKTRRLPRNPFVEYLKWHNGGPQIRPAPSIAFSPYSVPQDVPEAKVIVATGWYGANLLPSEKLFKKGAFALVDHQLHNVQTHNIIADYLADVSHENSADTLFKYAPLALIREMLSGKKERANVRPSAIKPSYTVITPFYEHITFFSHCATSIAQLIAATECGEEAARVEWIILNDDPRVDVSTLHAAIPEAIRSITSIISDGMNLGISRRQNQGVHLSKNEWILFLDCDDKLASNCVEVLDHYINEFPRCRFISSSIIDINENDLEIRRRIRYWDASGIFEKGMNAGHLAAIRRDLFNDIGDFDVRFSGCQDYDFALRAASSESILLVPEHLYYYRWHSKSQSVGQYNRQLRIANSVRRAFLRRFIENEWPAKPVVRVFPKKTLKGICLIRTQGNRLDLLEEAVNSVIRQGIEMSPCVIVHACEQNFHDLQLWAQKFDGKVILLHAQFTDRRRGYPLNVGLKYVEKNQNRYDFFCFLDDDDVLYPMFAERMALALTNQDAEVVVCAANSRILGCQPEPTYPLLPIASLVAGNFIPINAYVVRTNLLVRCNARLREDIDYLEDWDFLVSLLYAEGNFKFLDETLVEYRIIGDGNAVVKKDPAHFERCKRMVLMRGALAARKLGLGFFYRSTLDFDFSSRVELTLQCNAHIGAAADMFALMHDPNKLKWKDC